MIIVPMFWIRNCVRLVVWMLYQIQELLFSLSFSLSLPSIHRFIYTNSNRIISYHVNHYPSSLTIQSPDGVSMMIIYG
jgi:hypothetical protein